MATKVKGSKKGKTEDKAKRRKLKERERAAKAKSKAKAKKKGGRTEALEEGEEIEPAKGQRGKKVKEHADEPEARKLAYGKGIKAPAEIPGLDIDDVLNTIEKKTGLSSTGMGGEGDTRMSTGLLMLDLISGGGITAGWYTTFGEEQSCKSTLAMALSAFAVTQDVPIIAYADFEGSTTPNYVQNILNTMGVKATVEDVFGVKDRMGNYVKRPRIRYLPCDTAEQFFDYLAMLERTLPDKVFEAGEWWYVYENTNENRKKLAKTGHEYDKKRFSKYNKFYVPAENGGLQALLITDSYPAMLPERLDVDEPGAGLAAVARMFAEQLPRVKGKMRKKRIAVIGVNQLRDVPMAKYGPPKKQAAGNAVRFYSDVRFQNTARALSAISDARPSKDSPYEVENSVEYEGKDYYRYIDVRGEKNKFSQPNLRCWLRLWVEDGNGNARGFDPVWDTYEYLRATGQMIGSRKKKLQMKLEGNEARKPIEWEDFKTLILGEKKEIAAICKKIGMKPCFVRKVCFRQMEKKKGIDMYFEQRRKKAMAKGSDDDDETGGDDE
jgi:RecA/RadA recombinase